MSTSARTCLWYDGNAREAADFYVSLLPDSEVTQDSGMVVEFTLCGTPCMGLNGGPEYTFSEAASIQVTLPDQESADTLWKALTAEGDEGPCGWCKDRFGLSWQVVPNGLEEALTGGTDEQNQRAMTKMRSMGRLDLQAIKDARDDS